MGDKILKSIEMTYNGKKEVLYTLESVEEEVLKLLRNDIDYLKRNCKDKPDSNILCIKEHELEGLFLGVENCFKNYD